MMTESATVRCVLSSNVSTCGVKRALPDVVWRSACNSRSSRQVSSKTSGCSILSAASISETSSLRPSHSVVLLILTLRSSCVTEFTSLESTTPFAW